MNTPDGLTGLAARASLPTFPSASDDVGPGRVEAPDSPADLAALRRVSDAALGEELMRRRDERNRL